MLCVTKHNQAAKAVASRKSLPLRLVRDFVLSALWILSGWIEKKEAA